MKKILNIIFNHESWFRCNHCKIEFDRRFHNNLCPHCHKEQILNQNK